jgi:hypothetical protein
MPIAIALFPNIFVIAQQALRQPFRAIENPGVHGRANARSIIVADHNGQWRSDGRARYCAPVCRGVAGQDGT